MGDEQQFCLRWHNHSSTLVTVFDDLLTSESLVDVTLFAEGRFLKAHKVVLSACSPYFQTLFAQATDKHPLVILKDVKFDELKALLDYMYRGEVNVSQEQLAPLIKTAESLKIKGLADGSNGSATRPRKPTAETQRVPPQSGPNSFPSPSHHARPKSTELHEEGKQHQQSRSIIESMFPAASAVTAKPVRSVMETMFPTTTSMPSVLSTALSTALSMPSALNLSVPTTFSSLSCHSRLSVALSQGLHEHSSPEDCDSPMSKRRKKCRRSAEGRGDSGESDVYSNGSPSEGLMPFPRIPSTITPIKGGYQPFQYHEKSRDWERDRDREREQHERDRDREGERHHPRLQDSPWAHHASSLENLSLPSHHSDPHPPMTEPPRISPLQQQPARSSASHGDLSSSSPGHHVSTGGMRSDDNSSDANHPSDDDDDLDDGSPPSDYHAEAPGPSTSRTAKDEPPCSAGYLGWRYPMDSSGTPEESYGSLGDTGANTDYLRAYNLVRAGFPGLLAPRVGGSILARPPSINLPMLVKWDKSSGGGDSNLGGYPFPETPKQFPCEKCGRSYASTGNLKRHKKYECGVEPQFSCPICKKRFQHRHSVKIHVFSTHRSEMGDQAMMDPKDSALSSLLGTGDGIPTVGSNKDDMYPLSQDTGGHSQDGMSDAPFSCPICHMKFQHEHSVKIHIFTSHRPESGDGFDITKDLSGIFSAPEVGGGTSPPEALPSPYEKSATPRESSQDSCHDSEPQFSCPICQMKFQHQHSVKIHVFTSHRVEAAEGAPFDPRQIAGLFSAQEGIPFTGIFGTPETVPAMSTALPCKSEMYPLPQEASVPTTQNQDG